MSDDVREIPFKPRKPKPAKPASPVEPKIEEKQKPETAVFASPEPPVALPPMPATTSELKGERPITDKFPQVAALPSAPADDVLSSAELAEVEKRITLLRDYYEPKGKWDEVLENPGQYVPKYPSPIREEVIRRLQEAKGVSQETSSPSSASTEDTPSHDGEEEGDASASEEEASDDAGADDEGEGNDEEGDEGEENVTASNQLSTQHPLRARRAQSILKGFAPTDLVGGPTQLPKLAVAATSVPTLPDFVPPLPPVAPTVSPMAHPASVPASTPPASSSAPAPKKAEEEHVHANFFGDNNKGKDEDDVYVDPKWYDRFSGNLHIVAIVAGILAICVILFLVSGGDGEKEEQDTIALAEEKVAATKSSLSAEAKALHAIASGSGLSAKLAVPSDDLAYVASIAIAKFVDKEVSGSAKKTDELLSIIQWNRFQGEYADHFPQQYMELGGIVDQATRSLVKTNPSFYGKPFRDIFLTFTEKLVEAEEELRKGEPRSEYAKAISALNARCDAASQKLTTSEQAPQCASVLLFGAEGGKMGMLEASVTIVYAVEKQKGDSGKERKERSLNAYKRIKSLLVKKS